MATHTLQQMAQGGMYDQIGGGFHRYSVDEFWHIPHFEKMLYDNPQLASSYLDAFALTGDRQYAEVARGVLDYLMRDMTHRQGGIFSAEVQGNDSSYVLLRCTEYAKDTNLPRTD